MRLRIAGAVPVLALTLLVAGCGGGGGTGDTGIVTGDGTVTQLAVGERTKVGTVEGETLDGDQVSLADYRGKVVVVNVWGSWCPPCRAEAADLVKAYEGLKDADVVFLGINTRDTSKENALAFERNRKVPYASIFDPGGRTLLAFDGKLNPNTIPSTVVIDTEGRVAASIVGAVPSALTLINLVQDVQG